MSLKTDEVMRARGALEEIERFKKLRRFWPTQVVMVIAVGATNFNNHLLGGWGGAFTLLLVFLGFAQLRDYWNVKTRYPANLKLLRSLAEREGDSVYNLAVPPQHDEPLLEAWNRRLEKRALLWRLDHFLSGRGWPTN